MIKYESNFKPASSNESRNGRFVPILPNVNKTNHAKGDVTQKSEWIDGLPCSSKQSENHPDEITFDVAAEQEADIKSEPIQEEDFTADNDVTDNVHEHESDTSLVEVKTEVELDAPEETLNLNSETNSGIAPKLIIPGSNSEKKMPILYPKNVVSNSGPSNSNWRVNSQLTGFRRSGKVTNREFSYGIPQKNLTVYKSPYTIRCSNCNTTNTTLWRKFGDTGEYGCNSCVLYWKVNGVSLNYIIYI